MSIFKAYDIRGIYGKDLGEEIVYRIGRAYVIKFKPKKVVVGMDGRLSSPSLFKSLVKGITDQGCSVTEIGLVTTPMMYYSVWKHGYDGGLTISASHNPAEYNGVKMVKKDAVPIGGDTGIYEIEKMIDNLPSLPKTKGKSDRKNILEEYALHSLGFGKIKKKFKLVIDTANAVGGPLADVFFRKLGCEYYHLFPDIDGNFPNHEANPLKEENLVSLKKEVLKRKADLGISFDGDADRVGFVDEEGCTVSSDMILALVAQKILEEKPGKKILCDIRCSRVVEEVIRKSGGIPGRCMVGHSLVKKYMKEQGAYFAGELSSHFYFEEEHYAEAPLFVVLKILAMMEETNKSLSELVAPLKKYSQSGEINSKVEDKDGKMKEISLMFKDGRQNWMDGLTVEYDDWWFNVRPSNTEPYLRLNLEAKEKKMMEEKKKLVLGIIQK